MLYLTSLKDKAYLPLVRSEPVHLEQAKPAPVHLSQGCPHLERRHLPEDSRTTHSI